MTPPADEFLSQPDALQPDASGQPDVSGWPPPGKLAGRGSPEAHDPRLGFHRRFTPQPPAAAVAPPLSPGEQMGQGLYDDPYYRRPARPPANKSKRMIIIMVIIVVLLTSAAAAVIIPAVKRHNPNGLFQAPASQ